MVSQDHKTLMHLQLDIWRTDGTGSLLSTNLAPQKSSRPANSSSGRAHLSGLWAKFPIPNISLGVLSQGSRAALHSPKNTRAPSSSST